MAGIQTQTLAEVYARQGHYAEACEIYEALLIKQPDSEELMTRLRELEHARDRSQGAERRREHVDRLKALLRRVRARRVNL